MKIMFKEIMAKEPCFEGVAKFLNNFGLEESVRANPKLLKFLDFEIDTNSISDLDPFYLEWAWKNGVIAPTKQIEIVEGFEDFNPSLSFTVSPVGDAIEFFNAPFKGEPKFVDGEFVAVTKWNKILPTQADCYSMVITDLMEWCFFPIYREKKYQTWIDYLPY